MDMEEALGHMRRTIDLLEDMGGKVELDLIHSMLLQAHATLRNAWAVASAAYEQEIAEALTARGPCTKDDLDAAWCLLASAAEVATRRCAEAGYGTLGTTRSGVPACAD